MKFLARWFRHEFDLWEDIKWFFTERRKWKKLAPPVPYTHPRYGTFKSTGDGIPIHTEAEVTWLGRPIGFSVDATPATKERGSEVVTESFDTMDALMADQAGWMDKARAVVIRDMYPLWRDDWRNPDTDPALSEQEFWDRLDLDGISTGGGGTMTFWFVAQNDMFADHSIDVFGDLKNGFEDAELFG